MFGKIITRGRNSGLKRVSTGSLPPSLPFPCYFFPQTESLFTGYPGDEVGVSIDMTEAEKKNSMIYKPKVLFIDAAGVV